MMKKAIDIVIENRAARDGEQPAKEKVKAGLSQTLQEKIENAVDSIEGEIRTKGKTEIKSNYIGRKVMVYLRQLDEVAYVRFASVYRQFRDVGQFMKELKTFLK